MRPTHEFPDFDYDLPEIPDFVDSSWHNDVCPSLTRAGNQDLILWCDYADVSKRENDGTTQFCLTRGDYGDHDQVTLCESDDLADILAAIAANDRSRSNPIAITYTLSKHDDGYRIRDWFRGGEATLTAAANAGAPAAAHRILQNAYLGPDVDGVEVTWLAG